MQVERIHNQNTAVYSRKNLGFDRLEAEEKQTLTAEAVTFEGEERREQQPTPNQEEEANAEDTSKEQAPLLPQSVAKRVKALLDILA